MSKDIPSIPLVNLDIEALTAGINANAVASAAHCADLEAAYLAHITPVDAIASMTPGQGGLMHAASLLAWNQIAALADVPFVPVNMIASLPMADVWDYLDERLPNDAPNAQPFNAAAEYTATGGFWRTNLCAPDDVKYQLSTNGSFTLGTELMLHDPRIMNLHWGVPTVDILARPLIEPKRINGFPIEFRVFFGGDAIEDGAVSFYYPQAGDFTPTEEMMHAAETAREYGQRIYEKRAELGIIPMLPGETYGTEMGASLDFMFTEDGEVVFIDAGPGYGYGAHPCTFIDRPVAGIRWQLDEGVELR